VNSYFVLRVLAAQEMPHEREISCRSAAGEPDIHADRSEDQRSNSQFADKASFRCTSTNGRFGPLCQKRMAMVKSHRLID
jgi:hypothetical protein